MIGEYFTQMLVQSSYFIIWAVTQQNLSLGFLTK